MSLLSPPLVKLYIFNIFKLPLDADPFPALDGFCCCLPLSEFPPISPYRSGNRVPWIDCTSPGALGIWWQLFFGWN